MPTLKLATPSPHAARDLLLAAAAAGVDLDVTTGAPAVALTAATGETITEPNTAARHLASLAPDGGVGLLGSSPEEQAVIADWLAKRHSTMAYLSDGAMASLDAHLTPRTYLAGPGTAAPSLADLVLAAHLGDAISRFPAAQVGQFPAIARWYDHLVATAPRGAGGEGLLPAGKLDRPPLVLAVPAAVGGGGGGGGADKKADKKKGGGGEEAAAAAKADAKAAAPAAAAAAAAGAAAAAAAAAPKKAKAKAGKDGPQGGAAAATPAAAPSTSASPEDAAIGGLDFRVGRILSADKHPNADSLYVEQIDLGEPEGPRTVVSGLAKYCSLDSLQGRLVVVCSNLKPIKMRDVLSAGMVLCSSVGEVCQPIDPPAGASIGERVLFEGLTSGPPEPVHKKVGKLFDAAAPHLKVGEDGVCRFKDVPFGTGAGPVTSAVPGGAIK